MADVKKEKELAEKRKNDPPLELANDHPVRKLISRFRKIGDNKGQDPERGIPRVFGESSNSTPKIINVTESKNTSLSNGVIKTGGGASKWAKLFDGSSNNNTLHKPPEVSAQEAVLKKYVERNNETSKSIVRHVAKLNKVLEHPPPTIQEAPEDDLKSNLKKTESLDSGILRSNIKLDQISNDSSGSSNFGRGNHTGALSAAEQQMLTSLYDIRLEFKEEMEIMHQKMNRIDEQIAEVLRIFSPSTSPCSSHVSTYPCSHGCSKFTSPHNTNTNSVEHSPKTSISSSPRRSSHGATSSSAHQSDLANMCDDVINMDVNQSAHARIGGQNSSSVNNSTDSEKEKAPKPSEKVQKTKHEQKTSQASNSRVKSNRVSPEVNSSGRSSGKSSPITVQEAPLTCRDIDIPLKDRDLDIL